MDNQNQTTDTTTTKQPDASALGAVPGADQVRVGDHYCIDGVKYLVTLVHLGEAILTSRCGKFRIEKCSWILSYNAQVCDPTKEDS